jgi:very-short-patch-repair endonuclease
MTTEENNFTIILTDEIIKQFNTRKDPIIRYIKKNFNENIDYIKYHPNLLINTKGGSGKNKIDYKMTKCAFLLLENSYKLRQFDLGKKSLTHPIIPPVETASISFICNVFKDYKIKKQFNVENKYFIDLYFIDYKLAIECDEDFHKFNIKEDLIRQTYIEKFLDCKFYRFLPSKITLSEIIYNIMKLVTKPI